MIAALGAFDGFHLGHVRLFETARERAFSNGEEWGVISFHPHPQAIFSGSSFRYLFTEPEREALGRFHRITRFERIPFTRGLADMKPSEFLDWIDGSYGISGLVVGENFRFGRGRSGDCLFLREEGLIRRWSVDILPPVKIGHENVSSTLIRQKITLGETRAAEPLLGHPFLLSGTVIRGDQRGRKLGFPTANLAPSPEKLVPQRGVYTAAVLLENQWWPAALNIGFNPTFSGIRALRIEAHLIGFDGDLYGRHLTVLFLERLRGELQFPGVQELIIRMHEDISEADTSWRRYLTEHEGPLQRLAESFGARSGD
jgi:riboflavin kinase/FMN adenylyltransferase